MARLTRATEAWAVAKAAAVAVVGDAFAPYLQGLGVAPGAIHRVANWTRAIVPSLSAPETRARFGWEDGRQVVLHAGNMGFKQGLEQVVEAARIAAACDDPVRFVLAGGGNRAEAIRKAASGLSNVEFLGVQPDEIHASLLAAADVLLLSERPSQMAMSLPSKLTSYFAAGRPILAAVPAGGASSVEVQRSEAGLVVVACRPDDLLDALRRLRSDPALASRLGAAGQTYASTNTSATGSLAQAERFVDVIAGRRPLLQEEIA